LRRRLAKIRFDPIYYREAMALSDEEQEKLRDLLTSGTSNGYASREIARAWREEIERRVEALDRGDYWGQSKNRGRAGIGGRRPNGI